MWEITYYQSGNANELRELLFTLDESTRLKVARKLSYLSALGPRIKMPHSKSLKDGLFELRIRGKTEIRVFYCYRGKSIVLLHTFIKKTQKTPAKELEIAVLRQNSI